MCVSVYLSSLCVWVSVCPLPSSLGVWAPHRRGEWGSGGPGSAWRWPHRWSPPERRADWAHLSSDTSQLRSAVNEDKDCSLSEIFELNLHKLVIKTVWVHRFMCLLLQSPTSAQNAKKPRFIRKTTEVVLPWPSSFFNKSFFHLRELNKYKAQVSLPPSLQASATLLSSQHQTSRPPASQTPSDPSLGWGRSEPAAAHQEEHHHHHHHRAVRTALHPPGLEEVWETAYERRRSAGPAGGNLLRLDAYH